MVKMQDLNWNDLRYILAAARTGTLVAAARQLGVNETTVARRIAEAERRLGARLFDRAQGGVTPTEAGSIVIAGAEQVELQIQTVEGAVSGADREAAGTTRVTSVPVLVNRILTPALPVLLNAHPLLHVELIAEPRDLSLTKRQADVALRLARPRGEPRAVARRIGQLDYAVYKAARSDQGKLAWITYDEAMADLPQGRWIAERAARGGEEISRVTVNDAEALIQAVRAGLGMSLLPRLIADRDPELGCLSDSPAELSRELWLMVHPDLRDLTRIRVVMDWLVSVFDNAASPTRHPGLEPGSIGRSSNHFNC